MRMARRKWRREATTAQKIEGENKGRLQYRRGKSEECACHKRMVRGTDDGISEGYLKKALCWGVLQANDEAEEGQEGREEAGGCCTLVSGGGIRRPPPYTRGACGRERPGGWGIRVEEP